MSTTWANRRFCCVAAIVAAAAFSGVWMTTPGCEGPTAPTTTHEPPPAPAPGGGSGAHPNAEPATPAELVGLHVGAWAYRVVEGDDQGEVVRVEVTRAAEADDEATPLRRRRADGRVEHLGVAADGAVVLGAVEDPDDGVITRYEPPLTLVPAELPRGTQQVFEVEMTVRNIDPPHRVRGSGAAIRTVTYAGDEIIESPVGDFRAKRIEASFRGEMRLATITIDATEWYSPEVGLVREKVDERVRAALLFGRSQRRTITLEALPDHPAERD